MRAVSALGLGLVFGLSACGDDADFGAAGGREDGGAVSTDARDAAAPAGDGAMPADVGARDAAVDAGSPADASSELDAAVDAAIGEDAGGTDCDEAPPPAFAALLDDTNAERALYGSPPLCWSAELATHARVYAEGCVWAHDPTRAFRDGVAGENLAASTRSSPPAESLNQLWIDEKQHYDCAADACVPGEVCGHYTQLIWNDSGLLGCGQVECPAGTGPFGGSSWSYLVCRYYPPGNWVGRRPVPIDACP
jgi:hypothetical protein